MRSLERTSRNGTLSPWRAIAAQPEDWFSAEEIAKAKRYLRPVRIVTNAAKAASVLAALVIISTRIAPNALNDLGIRNWPLRLILVVFGMQLIDEVVGFGFTSYRELVHEKRWELGTQTPRGLVTDAIQTWVLSSLLFCAVLLPVWALIRVTPYWWLLGGGVMTLVGVAFAVIFPTVIAPRFNRYAPLSDLGLRDEILAIARSVGADVSEVIVEDTSKRTRRNNAYVSGLGSTRRLVLCDNLLERPRSHVVAVAAHEIGHWKLRHVLKGMPFGFALNFVSLAALALLMEWPAVHRWAGAADLRDPAMVPVFMLFFPLMSEAAGVLVSWLRRVQEREADIYALGVTKRPDEYIRMLRDIHVENLSDVTPSTWRRMRRSHPAPAERMELAKRWAETNVREEASKPTC